MKRVFLFALLLLVASLAEAQSLPGTLKNYALGASSLDAKFNKNTVYKTHFTVDAVVDSPMIQVHGNNWFPFHYIPSDNQKDYLVSVNCRLDQEMLVDQKGNAGIELAKTIVFEGYAHEEDNLVGIYLSQLLHNTTDAATGQLRMISTISIGFQTELSYDVAVTLPDTADNKIHQFQMAVANNQYYFFKDGRQLCVLNADQLHLNFDPKVNRHNVYLENNADKSHNEYLQALRVQVNELIAKTVREPPLLTLNSPNNKDNTIFFSGGTLKLSGQAYAASGIASIKIAGQNIPLQADGFFNYELPGSTTKVTITVTSKTNARKDFTFNVEKTQVAVQQFHPPIHKSEAPHFYALLFACSDYSNIHLDTLPRPIPETEELADELERDYQFEHKAIKIVRNAKFADLKTQITDMVAKMKDNDNLLISFSGHGTYKPGNKLVGYWIPVDGVNEDDKYLSSDVLDTWLADAKSKHILILSNTCFSGAFMDNGTAPDFDVTTSYGYTSVKVLSAGGIKEIPAGSPFLKNMKTFLQVNAENKTQYFIPDYYMAAQLLNMVPPGSNVYPKLSRFGTSETQNGNFYFILKRASLIDQ